jgi:hypothetical protein
MTNTLAYFGVSSVKKKQKVENIDTMALIF